MRFTFTTATFALAAFASSALAHIDMVERTLQINQTIDQLPANLYVLPFPIQLPLSVPRITSSSTRALSILI